MARAWHPHPHPSMTYFYVGCQPRNAWILVHAASLLPASPPRPFPAILWIPLPSQARICTEPQMMACGKVCDGGTRGLPFLSWTKSRPAHTLGLACHCAGYPSATRCWAAVRVTQWPADLREKTDVPINFCQNVITSGLENHMGVGRTGTDVWLSNMQSLFCRSLNNQEV